MDEKRMYQEKPLPMKFTESEEDVLKAICSLSDSQLELFSRIKKTIMDYRVEKVELSHDVKGIGRPFVDRRLIRNRAKCRLCGDVLESRTFCPVDNKTCRCGEISVEGGLNYIGRFATTDFDNVIELSEYEEWD